MERGLSISIATLLGACGFSLTPAVPVDGGVDDGVVVDVHVPDAGECMGASQMCAGPNTLRTCGATGPAFDTECTWACVNGTPDHCGVLSPSGGALVSTDLELNGVSDVVLEAVTINGETGAVTGTHTGTFMHKTVGGVGVFRAASIRFNGPVTLAGNRPIVFAANGEITVVEVIDARGSCVLTAAGPGGFAGGAYTVIGGGTGGGKGATAANGAGAGGAGHGAAGGRGGNGDGTGEEGGGTYGNAEITVLLGGSGGGGGGGGGGNTNVGVGGGGGGAVQLASNRGIRILAGGGINAGGCGGKGSNNDSNDGAGGGGSGGAILLEAPVVVVAGALAVNGGGGGAAKDVAGANGALARAAAPGGDALVDGGPGGAPGGLGGGNGASNANTGGGGGGGVGRIRVNTALGTVTVTGTLSPGFGDNPTTATRGTASIQ